MTDRVDAEPNGFRLLMPPGWRSFSADDAGRRSFIEALASRTRALGRPDLDVQLRMLVSQQWRALEQQRAFAVYLPVGESDQLVPPAAIAVCKLAVAGGVEFATGLGERFGISPERHATAIGQILRWRSSGAVREPLAEVTRHLDCRVR